MNHLSDTAMSNLFTKGVATANDRRQRVPVGYNIPDADTRKFMARLIYEEALETIQALGFDVHIRAGLSDYSDARPEFGPFVTARKLDEAVDLFEVYEPDLNESIDGCCDTIYVCTGALVAMGAPDLPHMAEVNRCNNAKFPGGKAITDEHGKYLKPPGWKAPDHEKVRVCMEHRSVPNLAQISADLVKDGGPR